MAQEWSSLAKDYSSDNLKLFILKSSLKRYLRIYKEDDNQLFTTWHLEKEGFMLKIKL